MAERVFETRREALPPVRAGNTHKVHIWTESGARMTGYVTVNEDDQGQPREVFVHGFGDVGSSVSGFTTAFAILLSFCLQHGVPLHKLGEKFARQKIDPHGRTDDPEIPWCWSIADYVIYHLVRKYGDEELIAAMDNERKKQ